jgi:hypothetical protein
MKKDNDSFLKIGSEMILTVMLIPFAVWLVTSIFELQASSGTSDSNIREIKEIVRSTELRTRNIEINIAIIKAKNGR